MSLLLKILFPRLSRSIQVLGRLARKYQPNTNMENIPAETEVEIIELAIAAIGQLQADREAAKQALIPLSNDNLALREVIRNMEADDARSDEAIGRLRAALPAPVLEPETDPGSGDGSDQSTETENPPADNPPADTPPAE